MTSQPKNRLRLAQALPLIVALAISSPLSALAEPNAKPAPMTAIPAPGFYFDGFARNRLEYTDWYAPTARDRTATFDTLKAQLGYGYRAEAFEAYAQAQFFGGVHIPDNASGPGDAFYTKNNHENFGDLGYRQANITFKQSAESPISAKVGRFLYSSGDEVASQNVNLGWLQKFRIAERLIGNSDYNVGRSFNGARLDRNDGPHTVTLTFSNPSQGASQANINPTLYDVDIATAAYTYAQSSLLAQGFFYYYGDGRGAVPVDNRPIEEQNLNRSFINIYSFGGSAVKIYNIESNEYIDTVVWGVGQSGNYGDLEHKAAALALEGGYQFRSMAWQPWFRAGWNYATGDHSATDNSHTTFSQLIPTARRYAQTPFYNMQNLHDLFIQAIVKPTPSLKVRSDLHYLQLSSNDDLLYSGAGPNDKTSFGMGGIRSAGSYNVGFLLDADVTYQITQTVSSSLYFGHLFPGGVIDGNFPAGRRDISYAFWDLNYKF